jgi:hypothetical protein
MREAMDSASMTAKRRRRDLWLAAAAFALAAQAALSLAWFVALFDPEEISIGEVGSLAGLAILELLSVVGFVHLGLALRGTGSSRARLWKRGAVILAVGWGVRLVGGIVGLGFWSAHDGLAGSAVVLSGQVLGVTWMIWRVAAVVLLTSLFSRTSRGMNDGQRNQRLGWLSVGLAVVYGLSLLLSDVLYGGREPSGLGAGILLVVAAVIAARSFFGKVRAYLEGSTPLLARSEMLLAIAAAAMLLSYAVSAIWSSPFRFLADNAGDGGPNAELYVEGVRGIVGLVAPLCAFIGFWISARSLRPPASSSTGHRRWFSELPDEE